VINTPKAVIANKARTSHKVLNSALEWINSASDPEITGNKRLVKSLRTGIYQVHRLATAAEAKMCVGVYGPSQAGKSYLVSALARKQGKRLIAVLGGNEVDFIEMINPEGGKESTGVVTRFTTDEVLAPPKFPIQIKLLSELDLIKLFVNSYVNDILQDEDDELQRHQEQVQRVLAELDSMPRGVSPLSVEDVYELEDYCNSRFSSNFRIQALKKMNFWPQAAELLPALGDAGRLRLVQVLWEELPSYSGLYATLIAELGRLGHAPQVFCAGEALFSTAGGNWSRSDVSIINVATLDQLSHQDAKKVEVVVAGGTPTTIVVPNLCALTSELVIPMRDRPHAIFDRTDLLDFPGARSRKGHPKHDKALGQPSVQVDNFLRGKVAYLFDKYSADLELTSMVLCIGPSNLEVVGLDSMVEDWIIRTHGEKPEAREKLRTSLFLVLSKFDQEFAEGAGKALDGTRWTTRLQASLLNSFGAHAHKTNWVTRWTNKSAFNNTFWLRNPNADQSGLIEYEGAPGSSREIGYSQRKSSVIATLKAAFLANPQVQQHFADPLAAWDSGMALNDGGASYLMASLDSVCTEDLKLRQIEERLHAILSDRKAELGKYYTSSDLDGLEREKLAFAKLLTGALAQQLTKRRLGEFISSLLESDIDTVDTFRRTLLDFEREKHAKRRADDAGGAKPVAIDPRLAEELGLDVPAVNASDEAGLSSPPRSFPHLFVSRFFDEWRARCMARFSSANTADYLLIERDLVVRLLNELEMAARRDGLVEKLTDYVECSHQYKSDDRRSWIWRQTAVVTAHLNAFIERGGSIDKGSGALTVTKLNGDRALAFEPLNEVLGELEVPEVQADFSDRYLKDWIQALQHSIRSNATFQAGITSDAESNRALGRVLDGLETLLAVEGVAHAR
jgi:hypothetical protein